MEKALEALEKEKERLASIIREMKNTDTDAYESYVLGKHDGLIVAIGIVENMSSYA